MNKKDIKIIKKRFEEILEDYSYKYIQYDSETSFYIIEDTLILLYSERFDNNPNAYIKTPPIHIEELTYNLIDFKYNHSKFIRELESELSLNYLSLYISYKKFRGFDRWYWSKDTESTPEYYNRLAPELELLNRHKQWKGIEYNYIVFEFESITGDKEALVAYTEKLPYQYVKDYINNSLKIKRPYGGENVRGDHQKVLIFFRSWKNLSIKKRLETKVTYFVITKNYKEKEDIWRYADKINENYKNGNYSELERYSYQIPDYRWVSEMRTFELTKKILSDQKVIFQHRPYFLKTNYGSQLSYDIYIPKLKIAIEYQGKQHYEPVDFFGGSETFLETQRRDVLKAKLSYKAGVKLIYINYWEELTKDLIEKRIKQAIKYLI